MSFTGLIPAEVSTHAAIAICVIAFVSPRQRDGISYHLLWVDRSGGGDWLDGVLR
jgi:hypothetical protein